MLNVPTYHTSLWVPHGFTTGVSGTIPQEYKVLILKKLYLNFFVRGKIYQLTNLFSYDIILSNMSTLVTRTI